MKLHVFTVIGLLGSLVLASHGFSQGTISGFVLDSGGKPIRNARYRIIGYSEFPSEGRMVRVLESGTGLPPREWGTDAQTDKDGRFVVTWPRHPLVELEFRHWAYGPAFVYNISSADSPLKVVMKEGKLLKGRVLDQNGAPMEHAFLEIKLPQPDVWYHERGVTDQNGHFQFRISEPPKEKCSWMLSYGGRSFPIDYSGIGPNTVIEFRAAIQMDVKVETSDVANQSQSVLVGTNSPPAAVGSGR